MRAIRIDNPILNSYLTDVSVDYSSGVSLSVRSNNSFAADDLIVVGRPGDELTEQKKVSSLSGNETLTLLSTLKFAHNKTTPIFKSLWDFVSIEGRSSSAGVFAELTQSPIQWDNKDYKTIYFHQAGTDSWQYRFRFYNSVSTTYSEYSDTLLGSGFTKFQMGYIIRTARQVAGDRKGEVMTTEELLRSATNAKNIVRAHNAKFWFWKVDGYKNNKSIAGVSGQTVYDLDVFSDLGVVNYIEYKYTNGSSSQKWVLRNKPDVEFLQYTRDLTRPGNDFIHFFRLLPPDSDSTKGYFEVESAPINSGVGTFYVSYYKEEDDYVSVEDSTAIIIPQILQDYLTAEIYKAKGLDAQAERYYKLFAGPEQREKTLALEELTGIALLDELDKQYKKTQSQPRSLWKFRGQKAVSRMYGSRAFLDRDTYRENYFDNNGYE